MFGPALIEAAKIEKNKSIYPRIVLSNSIVERTNQIERNEASRLSFFLSKDKDEMYFLDYLNTFITTYPKTTMERALLLKHKENIEKRLDKYRCDSKLLKKYVWAKDFHNKIIKKTT